MSECLLGLGVRLEGKGLLSGMGGGMEGKED